MLIIVVISLFLFGKLFKVGEGLLSLLIAFTFFGFWIIVDPTINQFVPLKRLRFFDDKPYWLFFASAFLLALFLGLRIVFLRSFFTPTFNLMLMGITTYLICGVILRFFWPYLKLMDLSIEVTSVEE
jgi:hypothetical protein